MWTCGYGAGSPCRSEVKPYMDIKNALLNCNWHWKRLEITAILCNEKVILIGLFIINNSICHKEFMPRWEVRSFHYDVSWWSPVTPSFSCFRSLPHFHSILELTEFHIYWSHSSVWLMAIIFILCLYFWTLICSTIMICEEQHPTVIYSFVIDCLYGVITHIYSKYCHQPIGFTAIYTVHKSAQVMSIMIHAP